MGSDQSNFERERENARAVQEEHLRLVREAESRERLMSARLERLERERTEMLERERLERERLERLRILRARQEVRKEDEQLQEAIRRSIADAQLHSSLNNTGSNRNGSNQTTTGAPLLRKNDERLCKTCKKPFGDKIFQCKTGHSSCEACWTLSLPCGLCRGPITNTRNFDLENYFAANKPVKCPNAAEGCILSFMKSELSKHTKICPFKEIQCPALVECNWKGKISQLSTHFDEEHPYSRQANIGTEMFLPNICSEYNSLQLIKLATYNFLFYVKVEEMEPRIYMDIQLIGTKATASKWNYEIHVYNKMEPRRKYKYHDRCRSSVETPGGISIRNCAVLPVPHAMSFTNEGTLSYKVYIKKALY